MTRGMGCVDNVELTHQRCVGCDGWHLVDCTYRAEEMRLRGLLLTRVEAVRLDEANKEIAALRAAEQAWAINYRSMRDELRRLGEERDRLKKVVARSATEGSDAARAYINDTLCFGTVVGEPEPEPEWVVEDKQCGHSSPDDGHFCTRPKGHGADHYAVDPVFGNIMDRWPCGCGKPYCGACSG